MAVVWLQVAGLLFMVAAVLAGRLGIDRDPTADSAERQSRIGHLGFYLGQVAPYIAGLVYPGPGGLDRAVHLPSLPVPMAARLVVAAVLLVPSAYFSAASNNGLMSRGKGTLAFKLTKGVVSDKAYGMVRNPMAVGYYLGCLAFAFLFGSTYLLVYAVAIILTHVFFLKVLEERELSVRYGESYDAYRSRTPFLIPRPRVGRVAAREAR